LLWSSSLADMYRDYGLYQRYRKRRFKGLEKLLKEVFAEYWDLDLIDSDRDVPRAAVSITGNRRSMSGRSSSTTQDAGCSCMAENR
jgi:hypothetical protein